MKIIQIISYNLVITTLLAFFSAGAMAANNLPRLQFGVGDVKAVSPDGSVREFIKGDVLLPGEKMVTGPGAMAQLRIFQQGIVVLKDKGQLELKPPVNGKFAVSLEKGLMRTVTKLGYRLGKIDVETPVAQIGVQSGDMLTGVGVDNSATTTTHNHVLDGLVKVKTSNGESVIDIGKIVQINPIGGVIKVIDKVPDVMKLRVPAPTTAVKATLKGATSVSVSTAFNSDVTKIAVLNPGAANAAAAAAARPGGLSRLTPKAPIGGDAGKLSKAGVKVNFDGVKVFDPRTTSGSAADQQTINSALILSIPSSISNTRSFAPVTTTDPVVKSSLTTKAQIVTLTPTTSVGGETTLSTTAIPEIKIVTYEPVKVVVTDPSYNPTLVNTIKNTTTTGKINTNLCATCTKSLSLIKR